ncbi:Putative 115 kDa protein in type-1 retrotransposable element R1DM, partial [Camponotus floridanus]
TEVVRLIKKRPSKNTAPGPDNIKSLVWKRVSGTVFGHLANIFTLCLRKGIFPKIWKRAILVLIPKGPISVPGEVKARPICLLDDIGKTLERIIADRINR